MESEIHLPKIKKDKVDKLLRTDQNDKTEQHFTEGVIKTIQLINF